jgi:two-component system cell cycle sensor histidine kinase/response regulator CckA
MSESGIGDARFGQAPAGLRLRAKWPAALLVAVLLGALAGLLAWTMREIAPPWLLAAAMLLSAAGLFALIGGLLGYIHIGAQPEQQLFFDGLADALGESCVVTDERGRALYVNADYLKLAAASNIGRLVGVENLYAGYPDVSPAIYRLAQAARDRKPATEEFRLAAGSSAAGAKTDEPVWIRASAAPLQEGENKSHTLWRLKDISLERAKQEQAFSQLQFIISYLDHAPAGFFAADMLGRVSYLNATLAQWLGLSLEGVANGTIKLSDIVPEAGLKMIAGIAPKPGDAVTEIFELDLKRKDGGAFPAVLIYRADFDTTGESQPARCLVIADKLEREQGGEAGLSRLINTAPIGIAEIDVAGTIKNANPALLEIYPEAKRGASLLTLADKKDRRNIEQAIAAARDQVGSQIVEASLGANSPRLVQLVIGRIGLEADRFVVYALDTTESKALEVQLAQSQKMQAVGQLAGGVAHDFNNVLTAIIGFSDLLIARHRPTDPAFADIMNIKQNANRAANLVRQLLAFSRRQTLRPEVISLTDVLSDLGNLLNRLLGEKVTLKVVHGRDIWPIKADINQFEQVIVNLGVNARDAMPKGGTLTIRTANLSYEESKSVYPGLMPPGEYAVCEVEDTGTGIPKDILDKIWEPFFSTKEVGKGTGLGLSTVYGIVKQTGGFIFCESEVGKGTIFRIYFPRHVPTAQEMAELQPKEEKKEAKRADLTGKGTILLVEDEDAVRAFAARALVSRGYTVLEANSGEQALEVFAEKGPSISLILSDVVMPEMDGPTLLKELRAQGATTKIIFISGYAEDAFEKHLDGQMDFAFLPKPFSLKQLAEKVKEVMES